MNKNSLQTKDFFNNLFMKILHKSTNKRNESYEIVNLSRFYLLLFFRTYNILINMYVHVIVCVFLLLSFSSVLFSENRFFTHCIRWTTLTAVILSLLQYNIFLITLSGCLLSFLLAFFIFFSHICY